MLDFIFTTDFHLLILIWNKLNNQYLNNVLDSLYRQAMKHSVENDKKGPLGILKTFKKTFGRF